MNFARIFNYLSILKWQLNKVLSTAWMRCYLACIGVKAPGAKFFGVATIKRSPAARIYIGCHNVFRSSPTSNLIGVNRPCIITAMNQGAVLRTGDGCGFSGTVIGCSLAITLGNNVRCGSNSLITDFDWHSNDVRSGEASPVTIEDDVWLGEDVKVLKGVTIGRRSVIGAGSVVVSDIPANVIAAGNPCKIIKPLSMAL